MGKIYIPDKNDTTTITVVTIKKLSLNKFLVGNIFMHRIFLGKLIKNGL